jgi:DNA modification methylase
MTDEQMTFEFSPVKTIKGFPELHWTGKRPYKSTQYFPAQLKERYGEEKDGWMNKIYWGDNLQVMSHLLKEYRGKIKFIYIDPPFDSKADYKKKIKLKTKEVFNDNNSFEEKQYGDKWTNDEYLQFMYERLILCKELLSDDGCIMVHCDYRKVHHLRIILDELFGNNTDTNFRNEIIWGYRTGGAPKDKFLARKHDNILFYSKSSNFTINPMKERQYLEKSFMNSKVDSKGRFYADTVVRDILEGVINIVEDADNEIIKEYNTRAVLNLSAERVNYPTQKPIGLLKLLVELTTKEDDIVFDCFMGSGTTQNACLELNRKFIGADINLGSVQTTTKRLLKVIKESSEEIKYNGLEVYNVNNYDFFRNPLEAKDLLIQALEIQKFDGYNIYDGELDGRMVKILPVNRIATKADLEELKANLPYKTFESRKAENPNAPVEKITLVCMGHEADLKASLEQSLSEYNIDVQIVDILRDKADLQLKREAEADIQKNGNKLEIKSFYPLNLMQKLSLEKESVDDWKQLVESIMIDWNYDGVMLQPTVIDIPDKNDFVKGEYEIPADAGKIKVKITDVLSETLEVEV